MNRTLIASNERVEENLRALDESQDEIDEFIKLHTTKESNIVKLSNATRGNTSDCYNSNAIRNTHAAVVDEAVKRFQDSVNRFQS